jgi:hypothetical protein
MHDPSDNERETEEQFPDSLTTFENDLNEALEQSTDGTQDEEHE